MQDLEAGKIHGRAGVIVAVVGTLLITAIVVVSLYETSVHLLGPPASPSYVLIGPPIRRPQRRLPTCTFW